MSDATKLNETENPGSKVWSPEDIAAFNTAEDERDKAHEDLGKLARENGFGCPADSEATEKTKPKDHSDEDGDEGENANSDKA